MYKGFWEKSEADKAKEKADAAAKAASNVRLPTIAEAQPTGDTAHKGAFWKNPEWQKKSAEAAAENNEKYLAGSGLWAEGTPTDGAYYKPNDAVSKGVAERASFSKPEVAVAPVEVAAAPAEAAEAPPEVDDAAAAAAAEEAKAAKKAAAIAASKARMAAAKAAKGA